MCIMTWGHNKFLLRQFKPQCLIEAERDVPPKSGLGGEMEMLSGKLHRDS